MDTYLELKFCKFKLSKILTAGLIVLLIILIFISSTRVRLYNSYNIIEINEKKYIMCNSHCNEIIKEKHFYVEGKKISYKVVNKNKNMYEINIKQNIKTFENKQIKIPIKKINVINAFFSIFNEKGV